MITAETIHGFSASLLQKNFDGAVESPDCHMEWWKLCCSKHPQVAIAAPRGHAKSTAITFAYTLANLVFRERSYVLIVSDTVTQAVQFLGDIKKELADNEQLRSLFKIKEFLKESEDDIVVSCEDGHIFRVQAKGAEQKLRGLKWNNKRPDLIVCDDLENDEIVMNKERRDKFRRWFIGALLPCKAVHGIVRYVGTILHTDSMLESLMPKPHEKNVVVSELKIEQGPYGKMPAWLAVKYKAHNPEFTHILWPSKFIGAAKEAGIPGGAVGYFKWLRQDFIDRGYPDVYSMEYLNIPIDESISYFKRSDFLTRTTEDRKKNLNYYVTVDLAISKEDYADYSVFLVAGMDENRIIHVVDIIRERLDGREIVDTILALEKLYKPEAIGIEEMQVTKAIGPFLREEMISRGIFPSIVKLKHGGKDKPMRAKSIQARSRAHSIKFDKAADWYQIFEDELVSFPRGKHDDQVDAFAYLGLLLDITIEASTAAEIEEEEYLDELRDTELSESGRSAIAGY